VRYSLLKILLTFEGVVNDVLNRSNILTLSIDDELFETFFEPKLDTLPDVVFDTGLDAGLNTDGDDDGLDDENALDPKLDDLPELVYAIASVMTNNSASKTIYFFIV
jgi:hypothetical protein